MSGFWWADVRMLMSRCVSKKWWAEVRWASIPDICHMHHMRCRCQNFQPGVKKSWINAKNVYFTPVFRNHCIPKLWISILENKKSTFVSSKTPHHSKPLHTTLLHTNLLWPMKNWIYAVLSLNQFCRDLRVFWCQIFIWKWVLVSKNDKYQVCLIVL